MNLGKKINKYLLEENKNINENKKKDAFIFFSNIKNIDDFKMIKFKKKEIEFWITCLNYFIVKDFSLLTEFKKNIPLNKIDDFLVEAFTKRKTEVFLNTYYIMIKNDKEMLINNIISGITKKSTRKITSNIRPALLFRKEKKLNIETIIYYFSSVFTLNNDFFREHYCYHIINGVDKNFKELNKKDFLDLTLKILKAHIVSIFKNHEENFLDYEGSEQKDRFLERIFFDIFKLNFFQSYGLIIDKKIINGITIDLLYDFLKDVLSEVGKYIEISEKTIMNIKYKIINNNLEGFNSQTIKNKIILDKINFQKEVFSNADIENMSLVNKNYKTILRYVLDEKMMKKFKKEDNLITLYTYLILLDDFKNIKKISKKFNSDVFIKINIGALFNINKNNINVENNEYINVINKDTLNYLHNNGINLNLLIHKNNINSDYGVLKIINIKELFNKKLSFDDFLNMLKLSLPKSGNSYFLDISKELNGLNNQELLILKDFFFSENLKENKYSALIKDIDFFISKNNDVKTIKDIENIFN